MSAIRRWLLVGLIGAAAACGDVATEEHDAGDNVIDAGAPVDGTVPAPDATVVPRKRSSEIAAGAGHARGSVYSVDVQVGHGHIEGRR